MKTKTSKRAPRKNVGRAKRRDSFWYWCCRHLTRDVSASMNSFADAADDCLGLGYEFRMWSTKHLRKLADEFEALAMKEQAKRRKRGNGHFPKGI